MSYHIITPYVKMACLAAELEGKAGPDGGVVTVSVEIPAFATGGLDRPLHSLLHLCIECMFCFWAHFDGSQIFLLHSVQAIEQIGNL